MPVRRYLDVVVVLVAAIPALALGAPTFGYLVGAGAWVIQRIVQANENLLVAHWTDTLQRMGVKLFTAFGRIWFLAGAIVLAGVVGQRKDGLTAALVIFGAYSVAFLIRLVSGPPTGTDVE
jgi:hypothetical protein